MYLYKYLHEDRIEDILKYNLLRFTQPKEFNDPFELRPSLKFVSDESILNNDIESNFESTIKKEYDENTQINQKMSFDTFLTFASTKKDEFKSLMRNVLLSEEASKRITAMHYDAVNNHIGVLSLTTNNSNLLMWAHYANSHKGFVVELDKSHSFFNQKIDDKGILGNLQKVVYSNERPNGALNEIKSEDVYLTKSKEWEYENEYRVFMHFDKADQIKNDNIYLYKFSPDVIKSIYLGANISEENKLKLLTLLNQDKLKHIKINQSHISKEFFKLKFESIR